ncbi:MAG: VanZ family protein [Clostridia bacterium]|nr:VanZ family protein [Clostridia bacterium]
MKKYILITLIIVCTLAVILWVSFIWSNSGESAEESGAKSEEVQEIVNEVAQSIGIEEPISEHTVRKTAHFGEYAILGALLACDALAVSYLSERRALPIILSKLSSALPIAFAVALIDEFAVQSRSEGRGPLFTDVLIDLSGAFVGTACVAVIFLIIHLVIKKRKLGGRTDEI